MRAVRVLLFAIFGLSFSLAFATQTQTSEPCSRQTSIKSSLHIAWIDCIGDENEVLLVVNGSSKIIDLRNYKIIDADGDIFTFANNEVNFQCCAIGAYDALRVHSGNNNNSDPNPLEDVRDLRWVNPNDNQPSGRAIWRDDGDQAELFDKTGGSVDKYCYGTRPGLKC